MVFLSFRWMDRFADCSGDRPGPLAYVWEFCPIDDAGFARPMTSFYYEAAFDLGLRLTGRSFAI